MAMVIDRVSKLHGATVARRTPPPTVQKILEGPGNPLDAHVRSYFEPRLGRDLSAVRIHTDPLAAQSAAAVNAAAYTVDSHIVFRTGRYQPNVDVGRRLLAHELAHAVQQNDHTNEGAGALSDDPALEREANFLAETVDKPSRGDRTPAAFVPKLRVTTGLQRTEEHHPNRVNGDAYRTGPQDGAPIRGGYLLWRLLYVGRLGEVLPSGAMTRGIDVEMTATFTPVAGGPPCPAVTFLQTVKPTINGVPDTAHLLFTREQESGASVDVLERDTEPFYGAGPDEARPGLGPELPQGSPHARSIASSGARPQGIATFYDNPVRAREDIPPGQLLVREFELAVVCLQTGDTFGSIRWGYTKTADGTITLTGAQLEDVRTTSASPQLERARQAFYSGFFQHSLSQFERGSDRLTTTHQRQLGEIASLPDLTRVVLVGANDASGGPESAPDLSLRRAQNARDYLIARGVDSAVVKAEGHGVSARVPNAFGVPVAENRRVDVHLQRGRERPAGELGSAREGFRQRGRDPRLILADVNQWILTWRTSRGTIPRRDCDQLTHLIDGLRHWRAKDPTVPDPIAVYGPTIRQLRARCESRIPSPGEIYESPEWLLREPNPRELIEQSVRRSPF